MLFNRDSLYCTHCKVYMRPTFSIKAGIPFWTCSGEHPYNYITSDAATAANSCVYTLMPNYDQNIPLLLEEDAPNDA